jgi:hypothetical protein
MSRRLDRESARRVLRETFVPSDDGSVDLIEELLRTWPDDGGTLWYPSAGRDLRDLMEFRPPRLESHGFDIRPHLFIHTDVPHLPEKDQVPTHLDERTRIQPVRGAWLGLAPEAARSAGLDDARGQAVRVPERALLLDVEVRSDIAGTYRTWLLDLRMSNYDFFVRFVVERGLRFSSLVQVRQGLGLGGCALALSDVMPWLAWAGCRQLIGDGEYPHEGAGASARRAAVHEVLLAAGAPVDPMSFTVEHRERGLHWSGLPCDASLITASELVFPLDLAVPVACERLTHPASLWRPDHMD